MPFRDRAIGLLCCSALALSAAAAKPAPAEKKGADLKPSYPQSEVLVVADDYFGTKVEDPFRWLEKGDDPAVIKWTDEQNAFTRKLLDAVTARQLIERELTQLWDYPKMGNPSKFGDYYFFTKNDGLQNQSPLYVQEGPNGTPKVLIDPNTLAADGTVAMDWWYPSESGKYVAYGTSPGGSEQSSMFIRDTATGKDLPETIEGCRFSSVAWLRDDSGFYYTRFPKPGSVPENERNYNQRVMLHKLNTNPEGDTPIFFSPAKKEIAYSISLSKDGSYLLIFSNIGADKNSEMLVKNLRNGCVMELAKGFSESYRGEILENTLYCLTTEGAPRGRVFAVDLERPAREKWSLLVPEGQDILEDIEILNRKLVLRVMHNATSLVKIYSLSGAFEKDIPLPPMGTVTGLSGKWDNPEVFIQYTSFTRPPSVFRYDFTQNSLDEFFSPPVPISDDEYLAEQVWYTSRDGTKVSMFVVRKKEMKVDGHNPCLLTGYGGFAIAEMPFFSPSIAWWLMQGGVFALPNLRGGSEYGEEWHRAGMLHNKQNVFDDFLAAAQWLVDNKYTSASKLAVQGGSNGGLLTGAALVQRPELFGAVLVEVPLLDMLRYHLFSIARYWIPEYGSSENREQFQYLLKYSPYQNVKAGTRYPPTMIMAGANDSRVDPLHARKMAALLQRDASGPGPVLLRVESKAGHGQGKPTAKRIEEAADRYAFIIKHLGMKVTSLFRD